MKFKKFNITLNNNRLVFYFRQTKTKCNKIRTFSLFEILNYCVIMAMVNKKKFNNIIEKELPISIVLFLIFKR